MSDFSGTPATFNFNDTTQRTASVENIGHYAVKKVTVGSASSETAVTTSGGDDPGG